MSVQRPAMRPRWLADAVISGFVAIGAATALLIIAYALANGVGTENADVFRGWIYGLTHNGVVTFSQASPAVALLIHVVVGVLWAIVYAWIVERFHLSANWMTGMVFAFLPFLASVIVFLPLVGAGFAGGAMTAGPLVLIGNFVLHMVYGFTLGQLYNSAADRPAIGEDLAYDEPMEGLVIAHAEELSAAGIGVGAVLGALFGIALGAILQPLIPSLDVGGWSVAIVAAGILAGGAVGAIIGSFAGLPSSPRDTAELVLGEDPFEHRIVPFLIPLGVAGFIAIIVVSFGSTLLSQNYKVLIGGAEVAGPVFVALAMIFIIGIGAWLLAINSPAPPASGHGHTSHSGH